LHTKSDLKGLYASNTLSLQNETVFHHGQVKTLYIKYDRKNIHSSATLKLWVYNFYKYERGVKNYTYLVTG
jgi:hypothetical protein